MQILAIETTDFSGSVAALSGEEVLAEIRMDPASRSAQGLAPAIAELFQTVRWKPGNVQLAAVATGPGSFTGLRVGVTTAKMFAYAVGAAVMGVHTLEAIAWQAPEEFSDVWAIVDAQRNQLFAGHIKTESNAGPQSSKLARGFDGETLLLANDAWIARLSETSVITGPVLTKLESKIPNGVTIIDRAHWQPSASSVGQLAWRQFQSGRRDDLVGLLPQYFRTSAAEEKQRQIPAAK